MKRIVPVAVLFLAACNTTTPTNDAATNEAGNNVVIEFERSSDASMADQSSSVDEQNEAVDVMADTDTEVMVDVDAEIQADIDGQTDLEGQAGSYTAYYDGVVGNGQESVLFFHATWCPVCQANDAKLLDWYSQNEYSRSVYKIDYDNSQQLKEEFGITGQDTFVLIDGNGNEIERVTFPSEEKLEELLG